MSYSTTVLADTPAGFWELDETVGATAADASGNAFSGSYIGSPTLGVAALINAGTAVLFNGSSQDVSIPTHTAFNAGGHATVEAWIKTTSVAANAQIMCADDTSGARYFQFRLTSAGKLDIIWFDTGGSVHEVVGTVTVNDGLAHHVVATYDGAKIHLFVDGVEDGTGTAAVFTLATSNPGIQIGARLSGGSRSLWLAATIDEVAVYTTALSPARVLAHYNAGVVITPQPSRMTQEVVEVLYSNPGAKSRMTQEAVEVLLKYPALGNRVTQVAVEVLIASTFHVPRNPAINFQNPAVV